MDIFQLDKKFQAIDIDMEMAEVLESESDTILNLNKEQLKSGLNSKAKKITPKYKSPYYSRKKNRMNPTAGYGTPDIELSGELKKEMDLVVGVPNDKSYSIVSYVNYAKYIVAAYEYIFGLTPRNTEKVRVTNTAKLGVTIKRKLGL